MKEHPSIHKILSESSIHDITWSGDKITAIVLNYVTEQFDEQFHLVPNGDEIEFLDNQGNKFHTEEEVLKGLNTSLSKRTPEEADNE